MDKYYMARMTRVEQTLYLYQLNLTSQARDWIKQHAQWPYDRKKVYTPGSPVGIMCSIEAMDECIARKSHELVARQAPTTLTTEAFSFPLPTLVQVPPSGEAPIAVCHQTIECRRYATSRSLFHHLRIRSHNVPRRDFSPARIPDPNVFSDSDVEVGAVPGRRAAGSSTNGA